MEKENGRQKRLGQRLSTKRQKEDRMVEVQGLGGMEEKKEHKFKTTGKKNNATKPLLPVQLTQKSTEIINKSVANSIMLQSCLCEQCNAVIYQSRFQFSSFGIVAVH